jgi:phospholipid/cholesterol/gamma-HCH transport system substrate-binding protein
METRASHLLVGLFVLALLAGLAAFALWLARVEVDRSFAEYAVAFTGSVSGLQEGSAVHYRGVPVGRVRRIRIDPSNIEQILVELEVRPDTPVKTDTIAVVEQRGITGIATIELKGGMRDSPALGPGATGQPPRIMAGTSALAQVFESTPVVLARIAAVLERIGRLLDDENLQSINAIIDDLEDVVDKVNETSPAVERMIAGMTRASEAAGSTFDKLDGMADDLQRLVATLEGRLDTLGARGETSLAEVAAAAASFKSLGDRLDRLVRQSQQPITDFSQTSLYEVRQLVLELRQLVATLTRVTREFERDPAGYLLGAKEKGFEAR